MSKYTMTDAAAKRIAQRLGETWGEHQRITIKDVERLLSEEDFTSSYRAGYVADLVQWLIENLEGRFASTIADAYIRSHYELRDGIDALDRGLHQIGILEYPEEDD